MQIEYTKPTPFKSYLVVFLLFIYFIHLVWVGDSGNLRIITALSPLVFAVYRKSDEEEARDVWGPQCSSLEPPVLN